jgi:ABC-type phosphate/phosphonate transport system ATPase subunit
MTRMQNLQKQLTSKSEDLEKLKMLFEALSRGSDQQATTLLAQLRLGDSINDLLSYISGDQQSSSR